MPASIKNILIGIFVIAAIGVVIFMLLFLHPSVGDNAKTLRVRFTDIDKVTIGTRVTFAGKPVGEVVEIQELPDVRTGRISRHGDVYVYELTLHVDSSVDVFNTDDIILRTSGLLGERNVEINPRPLKHGEALQNVDDRILYAEQTTSVEDTMKLLGELSKKFGQALEDVHGLMQQIKKEEIVKKVGKSVDNVTAITTALNQSEKLMETIDNVWNLSKRTNQSWTKVDQTLDSFQLTAANAVTFTDKANEIIDHARQGKGTIGKLFMGDDLYLRVKSILHKGEVVMDDINHYGILFHLDKRWQRLQANRLKLLEKLSCPLAFSHYFNTEMDQINDSLWRVSESLNQSECYPQSLLYDPEFTRRFSELLKRVEGMEESLKMYNQQVIDQEAFCN
jgi:phospholipid/cholesterol/gamma-HCH transport system substrate-binding protein